MSEVVENFRAEMFRCGINYAGPIVADGVRHRVKAEGDKATDSWYQLFGNGPIPAGNFGSWRLNVNQNWHQTNGERINPKDYAAMQRQWKAAEEQRAREEVERHERRAIEAEKFVSGLQPAKDHFYLESKKVGAYSVLEHDGELVLPLEDADGKVWSYQTIDALGDKRFMVAGRVQGMFFWLSDRHDGPLVICEGYATGASIHEATGWAVACAMNCGNLIPVAKHLREDHPQRTIVIAADNDRFTTDPPNPGLNKARVAAESIKGLLCVPQFSATDRGTDFNDLQLSIGAQAVRKSFEDITGVGLGQRVTIKTLLSFVPSEDVDCVLGNRYLCRGGSCMIVGQTHVGKSSFSMQMAIHLALGGDFFGLAPNRPLKSLIVQAENDDGDTAEMLQGILLGTGLCTPAKAENNKLIASKLEENLIIYRDQTHMGRDFPGYAEKLVELHQPDLFWIDPFLSFYGDDVNDQQAMSRFLRRDLNPISERTGLIWMVSHHTGKPSKDAKKIQAGWSARDFAYTAIGSSELSNWARAIIAINHVNEGEFRVVLAKRGWRAGLKDDRGVPTSDLYLAHGEDHICWRRIPKPDDEKTDSQLGRFAMSLPNTPLKSSDIVRRAAAFLQRGSRTVWTLWDGGEGALGSLFIKDDQTGLWATRQSQVGLPYKED